MSFVYILRFLLSYFPCSLLFPFLVDRTFSNVYSFIFLIRFLVYFVCKRSRQIFHIFSCFFFFILLIASLPLLILLVLRLDTVWIRDRAYIRCAFVLVLIAISCSIPFRLLLFVVKVLLSVALIAMIVAIWKL